jgi:type I restriction enzyme S subunit
MSIDGWSKETVEACLERTAFPSAAKLQTKDYRTSGAYPIIDQGQTFIAGWTANNAAVISEPLPLIVFGDHTRAFKFVDFPFVRGADGTQLLKPRADIDPRFFYYACRAIDLPSRGYNRHFTLLKEAEIRLAPSDEQSEISRVLRRVEDSLEAQDQQLRASAELKRATMRALFTRGLRGEAQKETEIGLIPGSWDASNLGAFFQINHGFAFDGTRFRTDGDYVLLTPGHFSEEGGFRDQGEKTKYYAGDFDQQYLLPPGSLLVAMTEQKPGLLGSSAIIPEGRKYLHNQRLGLIIQLNEECLDKGYLYHLFNYGQVRDEISRTSTGSKVKHTSPHRIREIVAPIPTLGEQREIAAVLDAIDRKIDLHRRKRAVLNELFKVLLHTLMVGKIRVGDLDLSALTPARMAEAAQ